MAADPNPHLTSLAIAGDAQATEAEAGR